MTTGEHNPERVLVFAPIGRDAPTVGDILGRAGLMSEVCRDLCGLLSAIQHGAATVFIAEEGLFGQDIRPLADWVAAQPTWSDLPFIVLTSHQEQSVVTAWRRRLVASLRNVSLLERPVQPITLTSAVQTSVRARMRQYQLRALLEAKERSAAELEGVVAVRTNELAKANDNLRTQMEEKARVEAALRQAQKIEAIGQLTGGIAHDFNNLLMVISGGLEMLDRQTDTARRQRIKDGMRHAAERGASLTRQLLAFSRKQSLKPEPVDLPRQVGSMRDLLARSLRGDVDVTFEFPEDLWYVEVDPVELELMVLNLAVNARDAMPNGGTITISAQNVTRQTEQGHSAEFVLLSVSDTGTGMSDEVKTHIFEPFFTTKDVGRGSGLGLAQVHGFAMQSGGSVEVESEIGQGTRVVVLLPRSLKQPHADSATIMRSGAWHRPANTSGSILLVEDDDEVGALVTEMLKELGYEVTRAASGSAALGALANGRKVDLVFSDIMMPGGMNGIELAREIRARHREMPVVLTSGYAEAARPSAEAEGLRILAKPYAIADLGAALRAALGRGELRAMAESR